MVTPQQLELLQSNSDSYESEYLLKWGYTKQGSVYSKHHIQNCLNAEYDYTFVNPTSFRYIGIDPKTNFAITVTQWNNDGIEVLYSSETEKPDYLSNLQTVKDIYNIYKLAKEPCDSASFRHSDLPVIP